LGIILDKDPNKLKLFNSGIDDEHSVNAITSSVSDAFAVLRGLDPTKKEDIVKVKKEYPELRSSAKKITFLAQYLGTHYKLIKELGVDEPTAKKMMESYWNFRQGTKDFINSKLKFYTENGYTVVFGGVPVQIHGIDVMKGFNTLDDYQDHISKVPDKGPYLDAMSAFRTAFNSETQSGAWATKRAMVNMNDWIRETGTDAKIIMEVHDALYLDVAISDLEETYQAVSKFMKEPIVEDQVIPLDTESEVGLSVKGELGIYEGEERKEILEKLRSF
jgi:DNA polymerase-1